jgi:Tfp pilus assembly protein FimV
MKHILLCVSIALGVSLSAANSGHAFSLGDIKVQSYLHAPLAAEVPLTVTPSERGQEFLAVIGDQSDYEAEGVPRLSVIETLRPTIMLGLFDVVRIVSTEPIEVPEFDLLLMVRTGQVTIIRNFPVVLSPDPRTTPMVVETAPPAKTPEVAPSPSAPAPQATSHSWTAEADWLANLPAQYGPILRGEMLYKVMERLRVPEPYVWQVAVRIWERNQERFVRGNLHGLRIGVYLDIPDDLRDSLSRVSRREAQQMVAAQWDAWQQPAEMVVVSPSATPDDRGHAAAAFAPAEPADPPSESMALASAADMSMPVNRAMLESVLQGFEKRLEQRLSLPSATAQTAHEPTLTFVSASELQMAIQGLEARLIEKFGTRPHPASGRQHDAASPKPPVRVGMETALASIFSTDSLLYVFMVQNVILLAIAAGIAWRWYRKRT